MRHPFVERLLLFLALCAGGQNGDDRAFAIDTAQSSDQAEAARLVKEAVNYWRGQSSITVAEMTVHRPDFERKTALKAWTKGDERSFVRFTFPPKDAGASTLTIDGEMWTFSPKTDRVTRIPPSMKAQSWMGSDFSYQDLSRDDDLVDEYSHTLVGRETHDGKTIYVVECQPHDDAPVVWGKEILKVRDDYIIMEHTFYDQAGKPVKQLVTKEVGILGGKMYPIVMRMTNLEEEAQWTEIVHREAQFDVPLEDSLFSVSSMQHR